MCYTPMPTLNTDMHTDDVLLYTIYYYSCTYCWNCWSRTVYINITHACMAVTVGPILILTNYEGGRCYVLGVVAKTTIMLGGALDGGLID